MKIMDFLENVGFTGWVGVKNWERDRVNKWERDLLKNQD